MNNPSLNGGFLSRYLAKHGSSLNAGAVAFYAAIDQVCTVSPVVAQGILNELRDQRHNLKLDRQRELQFAGHAAGPRQPADRQVRRGVPVPPVLRRLRQR